MKVDRSVLWGKSTSSKVERATVAQQSRMRFTTLRGLSIALIVAGAIAALLAAADRWRFEAANRSVEITVDQQDLDDFARAYGYDEDELLREMHKAGLTSVAVYAEQGQHVNDGTHAFVQSGQQVIDAARVSPLADRGLASLVAKGKIDANSVYLIVYDRPTLDRYLQALRTQLEPHSVAVVRATLPAIVAVKTQIDFFNSLDLGIPDDVAERVRRLGLLVDPRVQNNERLTPEGIDAVFDQMIAGGRIGTVIFYGQGNEVLGYPYQLDATAAAFQAHPGIEFGDIEAYTEDQIQKGTQTLGNDVVGQTVRVMAIPKLELDKLDVDTVVGEYLLGVRERNIRVIYYRPFPHIVQKKMPDGTLVNESAEQTNLDLLAELTGDLKNNGYVVGRASGFPDFKGPKLTAMQFVTALGVAAAFLLLLDLLGWARAWMPWAFFGVTALAFGAGIATGHGEAVRKVWAFGSAMTFGVLAGLALAPAFKAPTGGSWTSDALRGLRLLLASAAIATLGGLYTTGLLSQASFMIEIEQFLGVKALLVVPPLAVLAIYALTPLFGEQKKASDIAGAPVRAWMLAVLIVFGAAAALLVIRSGNQPDVGASGFELNVRGALTALMGARPRFKEFLIGYPPVFLLAALSPAHRRAIGWALVLAAAVGLADVLDTFSHIHTPLSVGVLRTFNGVVLGTIIGLAAQWLYRGLFARGGKAKAA
jgi:hypothetical protein